MSVETAPNPADPLANILTAKPLCEEFDIRPGALARLIEEGLPYHPLDATRRVFLRDEVEPWLREHGHLVDPYRATIKKLIDAAPPLTADQAAKIRAILGGAA